MWNRDVFMGVESFLDQILEGVKDWENGRGRVEGPFPVIHRARDRPHG